MKKLTVIFIVISITLAFSVLLSGCLVLPTPQPDSPSPPATEPPPADGPEPVTPPDEPDEPDEPAPMEDITWELEAYGDRGSLKPLIEDTEITAEFKSADSTVVGSAGCNSYFAGYEIDNDRLTVIPPIGATEMACPPPIMAQEQAYFELLETAEAFLIHNDKLIISCSANKEMVFTEKTTTEEMPPIEDIVWQLEAYGDRGSLKDLVEDTKITAELRSDEGRIVGSSGCNSYTVDYEIENSELSVIPPIGVTMMLCFPPPVMDQEQEYLELLKATETFLVHNDRLIISCSDNKEMVFIEEIPSIEDITWELEAYGDVGSLKDPVEGTNITAEFRSAEDRIVGSSGCNSYSADYEIDNYELNVSSSIGATMMLCFPQPVMDQEQEYFELIKAAETFLVHNDRLIISCSGNRELVFIAP